MGQYTAVVSNHNLNISCLKSLAEDLSKRLKANIVYGYNKTYFIENNTINYEFETSFIGSINYENAKETYNLIDENLGSKEFIEKYGFAIFDDTTLQFEDYCKECLVDEYKNIAFCLEKTSDSKEAIIKELQKQEVMVEALYDAVDKHAFLCETS